MKPCSRINIAGIKTVALIIYNQQITNVVYVIMLTTVTVKRKL